MKFRIHTGYEIHDAYCKCGEKLHEWRGIFEVMPTMVCIKCDSVYEIKLTKIRKDHIDKEVLGKIKRRIKERLK